MTLTEPLVNEHVSIQRMLNVLERVCSRLDAGAAIPPAHLGQILDFIRVFADQCHHGKEEAVLFPALERVGIPRDGGPIGVMLAEHTAGRQYVREMGAAIERYTRGDPASVSSLTSSAGKYITLLNAHIEKENGFLFPMAEAHLPEETHRELAAAFARVDVQEIGEAKHEELRTILRTLTTEYLT